MKAGPAITIGTVYIVQDEVSVTADAAGGCKLHFIIAMAFVI
jgi:hypothetical protein